MVSKRVHASTDASDVSEALVGRHTAPREEVKVLDAGLVDRFQHSMIVQPDLVDAVAIIRQGEAATYRKKFLTNVSKRYVLRCTSRGNHRSPYRSPLEDTARSCPYGWRPSLILRGLHSLL